MVQTVAVLVIACLHALGPAIPMVIAIPTPMVDGILVEDHLDLEPMRTLYVGYHSVAFQRP